MIRRLGATSMLRGDVLAFPLARALTARIRVGILIGNFVRMWQRD